MKPRRLYALALAFLLVPGALFGLAAPSGPEIRVAAAGIRTAPQTAVFPDGGFVVAWTTGAKVSVIHARLFAASGTPVSAEIGLMKPANQVLDGIAVTSDGGFVVVWEQPRPRDRFSTSVFARKLDRHGNPLTAAFQVHQANPLSRYNGKVAGTADGGFVVAWASNHSSGPELNIIHTDAVARFFHGDGTAAGPALQLTETGVPTDDSGIVPAAMAVAPDGSVALVSDCFCDQPGLLLQRFTSDGVLTDLDPIPPGCIICQGELQLFPSLSMAPDGSFVVAWVNGFGRPETPNPDDTPPSEIRASRLAPDGRPLGDVLTVNQHGRFTAAPQVAVLADGSFVVAWIDRNGRDGSGLGVFARTFDAAGNTSGPDLQLDLRTGGDQILSSIAAAGRAVAVWMGGGLTVDARLLVP
ncbi:MAG TPA: hypothetical protein VLV54_09875 [Thermoanaerobaculia bacterium]|nr:hypothetical protein [Thermoanaerobaculia bacterium]